MVWPVMKLSSVCCLFVLPACLLSTEIAEPLSPELEQLVMDVAAVPDPLVQDWRDPRNDQRVWERKQAAVIDGCRVGTKVWPAIPALISLTGHPTIQVSVAAATILASVKTEEHPQWKQMREQLRSTTNAHSSFEYLVRGRDEGMRFYSNSRRKFAVRALGILGPSAKPAAATLIRIVESRDERDVSLWCDAAAALSEMQMDASTFLPTVRRRFAAPEEELQIRASAADALACAKATDDETMAVLRTALNDQYSQVRLAAARALLILSVPLIEVKPTLSTLLQHKLASIRTGALRALAEIGPRASPLRSEIERLTRDSSASVRAAAEEALEKLEEPQMPSPEKAGREAR
ncbi:MAG: hypothetical protein ACXW32_03855 [Limisphaerales bacterium]